MDFRWNTLRTCYILLYGFIIGSVISSMDLNFNERIWRRNVCLEEKNLTGAVSISISTSLLICASLCSKDQNCVIFNFNEQQQKCHGYSAIDSDDNRGNYASDIQPVIYNEVFTFTAHRQGQNFSNALATCAADCKRLLILDTAEKISYIRNRTDLPRLSWIGLTDQEEEGKWLWVDGSKFVPFPNQLSVSLNNIDANFDDSRRNNADCALFFAPGSTIIDEHCSDLKSFVCETY